MFDYHLRCFFHRKQTCCKMMVDKGFKSEVIAVILLLFDILTMIEREDIKNGVEYIRGRYLRKRALKGVLRNSLTNT